MRIRRLERVVYKATNIITNKSYIGYCVDFKERKSRHLRNAKNGIDTRFYRAIRKYGENNFIWEKIYENLPSIKACKTIEKKMILKYNTYVNGYNSTLGGDGGFTGYNSGVFKKGLIPWNHNKKLSPIYIQKLKDADRSKSYRPVLQYTLNGKFIREWSSCKDVQKKYNFLVHMVASNKYPNKSAYGFMWKYKNGRIYRRIKPIAPMDSSRMGKRIVQLTLNGQKIKVWKNAYTVWKIKGFHCSSIGRCLNGIAKTAYKYKWKYY